MKKPRQDYSYLGVFPYQGYEIKVLADLDQILKTQLPHALKASGGRNRQIYGPFRVTVKVPGSPSPKQKRTKKKTDEKH